MREDELDLTGTCIGIGFEDGEKEGDKKLIRIYIEDDENWHKTNVCLNRFWIDDFVETLMWAKEVQDSVVIKKEKIEAVIKQINEDTGTRDELKLNAIVKLERFLK